MKRIAKLPYNHELYLEAVRTSRLTQSQTEETRQSVNALVEKILGDTDDEGEFEELLLAANDMTRVSVALRWSEKVTDPVQLENICNLAYTNNPALLQAMTPLFEKTFREFPADGILAGSPVEHAREITAGGTGQFREFCARKLEGSDREKAMRLLRNSGPSVDEIEMMLATETDPEEREFLGREVVNRARQDGFMLAHVAENYPRDTFGKRACETLVRNWENVKLSEDAPSHNDIQRLQKLYPALRDQLAMLLPLDPGDAMDRINEDLE